MNNNQRNSRAGDARTRKHGRANEPGHGGLQGRGRTQRAGAAGSTRAQKPRVDRVRLAAYDILRDVDDRDAYANLLLPSVIKKHRFNARDAGFLTELVAGTLRLRGRYNAIIALAAERNWQQIDARTLRVLQLAAHQIFATRVAHHAAIYESVELQRLVANKKAAGFVNGVLRTLTRTPLEGWLERIRKQEISEDAKLAQIHSHPEWVVRALREAQQLHLPAGDIDTARLLEANNETPRVNLALLPRSGVSREELIVLADSFTHSGGSEADESAEAAESTLAESALAEGVLAESEYSPCGLELRGGNPARLIEGLELPPGTLRVQDQGSQLAALALARAGESGSAEKWLDLCAGPGGKTALLAAEAEATGAKLWANEAQQHRAKLVTEAVCGYQDIVTVTNADGRDDAAYSGQMFERIMVDAPCTGLGALRRRPEARWRKQSAELPQLVKLQEQLLDKAVTKLKPGGYLAYVTCSPHPAETRGVLKRTLKRHSDMVELDTLEVLNRVTGKPLTQTGKTLSVQLWPDKHGTDAMFISLLQKVVPEDENTRPKAKKSSTGE